MNDLENISRARAGLSLGELAQYRNHRHYVRAGVVCGAEVFESPVAHAEAFEDLADQASLIAKDPPGSP